MREAKNKAHHDVPIETGLYFLREKPQHGVRHQLTKEDVWPTCFPKS
jgi:hypothetical protein